MRVTRITADLPVADIAAAKGFSTDCLGLTVEDFNLGWVARYTDPDTGAHVQLLTGDAAAPEDPVISVHADDVDAAYARAGTRLRDRVPAAPGTVGGSPVLPPGARRQRAQHRPTP